MYNITLTLTQKGSYSALVLHLPSCSPLYGESVGPVEHAYATFAPSFYLDHVLGIQGPRKWRRDAFLKQCSTYLQNLHESFPWVWSQARFMVQNENCTNDEYVSWHKRWLWSGWLQNGRCSQSLDV